MTGWMQKAIAWQLLEHGVLTSGELHGLIAADLQNIINVLGGLRSSGVVVPLPSSYGQPGVNRKVYSLSRKGIDLALELALNVEASDLKGMREPSDPLFKQPQTNQQTQGATV